MNNSAIMGSQIAAARALAEISQTKLAERAQMDLQALVNLEARRNVPTIPVPSCQGYNWPLRNWGPCFSPNAMEPEWVDCQVNLSCVYGASHHQDRIRISFDCDVSRKIRIAIERTVNHGKKRGNRASDAGLPSAFCGSEVSYYGNGAIKMEAESGRKIRRFNQEPNRCIVAHSPDHAWVAANDPVRKVVEQHLPPSGATREF